MKKILGIIATFAIGLMSLIPTVLAPEAQVIASVQIPASCGIVANPTTINFGQVATGGTSEVKYIEVTNQGSVTADVSVKGTDWSGTAGSFDVSNTLFGTTSPPSIHLALINQYFASISNGATQGAYFQMSVPHGQAAGNYSQTITFTATC